MIDTFTDYILADISSPITLLLLLVVSVYFISKFLFKHWGTIKSYFENSYQNRKKKEELYETVEVLQKAKDDIIAETKALSQAQKDFYDEQLKYRNVSQQLRDNLQEKTDIAITKSDEALSEIKELHLILEQIQTRQEEIDADRKAQKVNELRQDLINAYHYFTSKDRNPDQSWNEMEAHAFWSMFKDYERYGGNDFAHEVIQPAMNKLKEIPITREA